MALQTKTVTTGDYSWQSWSNGYAISLTLTEESTNIAANTSQVSYLFTISNTDNIQFYQNNNSWSISIGGQTIAINRFNFDLSSSYTTQTIASGTLTVVHNVDGTLNMPYNVSIPDIKSANKYGPPAMTLSGTWTLTPIPRTSGISCPNCTIGKATNISIQKADSGFTHTVSYEFGSLQGTIADRTAESTVQWMVPTELYTQIPNAKSGKGVLICKTYNGNTLVGESSCELCAYIDEADSLPVISAQVEDTNSVTIALTGDCNTLVRYCSDVLVNVAYTAKNGASMKKGVMTHNGKSYNTNAITIADVENGVFDFTATDTRGLTNSLSVTKPVIPYVKLTCNLENNKPDGAGNMTISVFGNYFAKAFGATDNELTVQYRYKRKGTSWPEWQTMEHSVSGNSYTGVVQLTGLDYQKAYTFQARAIDKVTTVESTQYTARATPVFDWGENDFQFHVPVYGITPQMVGIQHTTNDGAFVLQRYRVEAGLLFVRDNGNLNNYYLGVFSGYQEERSAHFTKLSANTLDVVTNTLGTVTATGAAGEVTYVIIPFVTY